MQQLKKLVLKLRADKERLHQERAAWNSCCRGPPRCCVLQDMFGMYGSSHFEFPIVLKTPDLVVAVLQRCQQSTTQALGGSL